MFEEKLIKAKNEIKVRVLIKRLYDAKEKLDQAFAEIDAVNRDILIMKHARDMQRKDRVDLDRSAVHGRIILEAKNIGMEEKK